MITFVAFLHIIFVLNSNIILAQVCVDFPWCFVIPLSLISTKCTVFSSSPRVCASVCAKSCTMFVNMISYKLLWEFRQIYKPARMWFWQIAIMRLRPAVSNPCMSINKIWSRLLLLHKAQEFAVKWLESTLCLKKVHFFVIICTQSFGNITAEDTLQRNDTFSSYNIPFMYEYYTTEKQEIWCQFLAAVFHFFTVPIFYSEIT